MDNQVENLIGLATRARKVTIGTNKILSDLAHGSVQLLLIAEDASDNTKQRLVRSAEKQNVPYYIWNNSDRLATISGNSVTIAIAITDAGFAKTIKKKMTKNND